MTTSTDYEKFYCFSFGLIRKRIDTLHVSNNEHDILMAMLIDNPQEVSRAMSRKEGLSEDATKLVAYYFHPDSLSKKGKKYDIAWAKREDIESELLLLMEHKKAVSFLEEISDLEKKEAQREFEYRLYSLSIQELATNNFLISEKNFIEVLARDEGAQQENFIMMLEKIVADKLRKPNEQWTRPFYEDLVSQPPFNRNVIRPGDLSYSDALNLVCKKYKISIELCRKILDYGVSFQCISKMKEDLATRLHSVEMKMWHSELV